MNKSDINSYTVRPLKDQSFFSVEVPGSKSITNRALLLAAMGTGECTLNGVLFSEDSRAFLSCLRELGFTLDINENDKQVRIEGTGGSIPNKKACINVGSAGTAARFLTVFLAFAGGDYELNASAQMCRRPMEPLISSLRDAGVTVECMGEEGHFPFKLKSDGIRVTEMISDTDVSSQFASAILMASPLIEGGLTLKLTGSRTNGAYIGITLRMMKQFGFEYKRINDLIYVSQREGSLPAHPGPCSYDIEPDVSAACYFYAMSAICNKSMQVKKVHPDCMQGDIKFIHALTRLGCTLRDDPEGLIVNPPEGGSYDGIDINMKDFSDQTMTMAVVAAFANNPVAIHDVGHIRYQECDRLNAIITELNRVGISCEAIENETGLKVSQGMILTDSLKIETYDDHRIAMAFSLLGLRIPGITILNPMCCRKTFENYFDVLDSICK